MIAQPPSHEPESVQALAQVIRAHRSSGVRLMGTGTKAPLVGVKQSGEALISSRRLAGILDYSAAEFTVTALAGTPIRVIEAALAEHGQYLPFDPPFTAPSDAGSVGATLGGAIASGLAGPGRVRFGGVRDFVLAVTYVDGRGRVLRGGAKVVKNAAGFDLPKLLAGSLGRLAALAEITLKVLPRPAVYQSARFCFARFQAAYDGLVKLGTSPFDFDGLELLDTSSLLVRWGGSSLEGTANRLGRLERMLGLPSEPIAEAEERALWETLTNGIDLLTPVRRCDPAAAPSTEEVLIKVALSPSRIPTVEAIAQTADARRRYSAGGAAAWLGLNITTNGLAAIESLNRRLAEVGLPALLVRGPSGVPAGDDPRLGLRPGDRFLARIKHVLDPHGVLPPLASRDSPTK